MDLSILYGDESTQHDLFIEAAEEYFDTVTAVPVAGTRVVGTEDGATLKYRGTDLSGFDASFIRFFGSDMLFGEQIPEVLAHNGVYTQLDPDSLTIATNKFYAMKVLAEGGVPVPRSAYVLSTEETERSAEDFGYPVVLKLISGYGGEGVMRASNASDLGPFVDTLTLFEQDVCLQEFVEHPGEDVRVIVIGDETYTYKRVAGGEEEWRSNISQGADREEYDAPEEVREAAVTAARLAGFDICGVDIIQTEEAMYVIELNMSPGVPAETQEVVGADLPDLMMRYVHEQATSRASERGL
ncbi:MAG: RimK family alpha-L-glutamate ligase [Candidatus Nanohaloarchaea archaeon]|nr:RimK family alpha-L-glutamate ligase [Candidatus Nanohaloarchaea archaeon]